MVRTYEHEEELPGGLQEDWDFLMAVYDLLNARAPESGWTIAYVSLEDEVGSHQVETIEEAREAYEEDSRGDVASVMIRFHDVDMKTETVREFSCRVREQGGRVAAASLDEPEVVGVVGTVSRLANEAVQHREAREASEPSTTGPVVIVDDETEREGWRAFAYNPWTITIAGGLIVAIVLAVVGLPG